MPRLTPEQKQRARNDYEVHGLGVREIARKYKVAPSTVSSWVKSGGWELGKAEHLIEKKKNAIKDLYETEQQTKHLNTSVQISIDNEVEKRLEAEQIFTSAAMFNQNLANKVIKTQLDKNGDPCGLDISELESHSRITSRNKETVLGKSPDTAIQTNISSQEPIVVEVVDASKGSAED